MAEADNHDPENVKPTATGDEGVEAVRETFGPDGRFEDAAAGQSAVNDGFNLWTGLLADRGLTASYAVIGAAWAVFGTTGALLDNRLALGAVLVSVLYIGIVLTINFYFVRLYWKQFLYAKEDPRRWQSEYEKSGESDSYWPYTKQIDELPMPYNRAKLFFPALAVILLVAAIALSIVGVDSVEVA